MSNFKLISAIMSAAALVSVTSTPSQAASKEDAAVMKCDASYGTIAITDGDTQGWSKFGLSSPRGMLGAIVQESGCFTLHTGADGRPANYLLSAIAGSQEEIDQTMNTATSLLKGGLVQSGAAGTILTKVPMGGALIGMFGGLGGKKKTISAGLRLINPANGQTLISGSGLSQKSTIKILNSSDWVAASQGEFGQYSSSKDGQMVTSAFIEAYNSLASQAGALASAQQAVAAAPAATVVTTYTVAVATSMRGSASETSNEVRSLRPDTELVPTGKKEGLFVEVTDNYGTKGWVSVEDLR